MLVYLAIRYLVRTPFGLALQGVRDDPIRMGSLGYNVAVHRTMAFGVAGFVAALGGVLFVWWNGHIDPASINIGAAIDLLVICVIGGPLPARGRVGRARSPSSSIQNYVRTDDLPVVGGTFHTLIGVVFLLIVLVSPGGLMGIWDSLMRRVARPSAAVAAAARSVGGHGRRACRQDRRVKGGRRHANACTRPLRASGWFRLTHVKPGRTRGGR